MVSRTSQWLELLPLSLIFICLVGCRPIQSEAEAATLELDRSIRLRFDCPPIHGDAFAIDYLPAVWRAMNASASHLTRQHDMRMCQSDSEVDVNLPAACLAVSGGLIEGSGGVNKASVYLIRMDLHSVKGRQPSKANRMAFHQEAALLQASIKALEGLEDCARLNVTVWERADCEIEGNGSCPSPGDSARSSQAGGEVAGIVSAVIFIAFICCIVLAALLLVRRRQLKELERQQQQQQQPDIQLQRYPTTQPADEPRLSSLAHRQQRYSRSDEPQPRRRSAAGFSAATRASADASSSSASWIVGPPLPAKPRMSSISWLNLAYNTDDDEDDDSRSSKDNESGDGALPSRLTRFRAVGEVDEAEARRQFARLGDPVGGDPGAFYRVGDMSHSESWLAFVLANSRPDVVTDERILELIWACDGFVVSLDPSFVDRLSRPYVTKMRSVSQQPILSSQSTSPLELTSVNSSPSSLSTWTSPPSEHTTVASPSSEHTTMTSSPSEDTTVTSPPSEHTTSKSTVSPPSSRFHLLGWERRNFPCHILVTATIHCLDTNLSKRLRVCQFAGRLNTGPDGGDIPASLSEFVRFSRACADQQLTATSSAPSAAVGRGHSSASLLPLLLLAARRTRLSDSAERGGGSASCDLLRLAAGLRRQCPLAVGSEAQYLFLMRCLHAYACLMKRNSI